MKSILSVALVLGVIGVGVAAQRGPQQDPAAATRLPPLSLTCPMHPDVVEAKPGSCPVCRMALVPVRLDTSWMCPLHTHVMESAGGTCRLCGRPLVRGRVSLTFTCASQPGIDRLEPGRCPDGSPTIARRTLRPHGNHNPQHGGQFFMAPDNWHHLEGTYPRARTFRLYLYDDYARALAPADMKQVQARVVTREVFDPGSRKLTEVTAFPLRVSRDGAYLEARVDTTGFPAEMTAKLRIKPDSPEYRFDFTFPALTREPAPTSKAPAGTVAGPRPVAAPAPPSRPSAAAEMTDARAPADASADPLAPLQMPGTLDGIVEELRRRDRFVRGLIDEGNFAAVWVPSFQAKDLAIALEPHLPHLTPTQRNIVEPALQEIVRLAWLLDAFGDVGNRPQLDAAHRQFSAAIAAVAGALAPVKP